MQQYTLNALPSFLKLNCVLLYYMSSFGSVSDCRQVTSERIITPYSFLNAWGLNSSFEVPFPFTLRAESFL